MPNIATTIEDHEKRLMALDKKKPLGKRGKAKPEDKPVAKPEDK